MQITHNSLFSENKIDSYAIHMKCLLNVCTIYNHTTDNLNPNK